MQYSPKLKKAIEEIKAIVKKYDIGATVILHSPGFSEFLNHIETSYSCATMENDHIRFRTKGRNKGDIQDTVNMISHFAEISGQNSLSYFNLKDILKEHMDINEDDGNQTSHTQQNN